MLKIQGGAIAPSCSPLRTPMTVTRYFYFVTVQHWMTPISYCLDTIHPLTPCIHTRMLFSRFYTLLCALVIINTTYSIYFFLIHHCTNSLSSLHIFVRHCTFCASLHTKTSPA